MINDQSAHITLTFSYLCYQIFLFNINFLIVIVLEQFEFEDRIQLEILNLASVFETVADYLHGFTYNIIAVDYRNVSSAFYPTAVLLSNDVAKVIANSIIDMRNAGVREEQFLLTGFSLGGQIVGAIGRNLNFTLREVIGTPTCY